MSSEKRPDHWLARKQTIKRLWQVFALLLTLTVLLQFAIDIKGYFQVDSWLGFGAAYGFLSCLAMVFVAKGLGYLLKRNENYYNTNQTKPDD